MPVILPSGWRVRPAVTIGQVVLYLITCYLCLPVRFTWWNDLNAHCTLYTLWYMVYGIWQQRWAGHLPRALDGERCFLPLAAFHTHKCVSTVDHGTINSWHITQLKHAAEDDGSGWPVVFFLSFSFSFFLHLYKYSFCSFSSPSSSLTSSFFERFFDSLILPLSFLSSHSPSLILQLIPHSPVDSCKGHELVTLHCNICSCVVVCCCYFYLSLSPSLPLPVSALLCSRRRRVC